jgi:hypothetical protein
MLGAEPKESGAKGLEDLGECPLSEPQSAGLLDVRAAGISRKTGLEPATMLASDNVRQPLYQLSYFRPQQEENSAIDRFMQRFPREGSERVEDVPKGPQRSGVA